MRHDFWPLSYGAVGGGGSWEKFLLVIIRDTWQLASWRWYKTIWWLSSCGHLRIIRWRTIGWGWWNRMEVSQHLMMFLSYWIIYSWIPPSMYIWSFSGGSVVKNLPANVGCKRHGFDPWVGKIHWSRKFQYSCLGKYIDREAWRATVHGVAKSQTRLSDWAHVCMGDDEMALLVDSLCVGFATTCNWKNSNWCTCRTWQG